VRRSAARSQLAPNLLATPDMWKTFRNLSEVVGPGAHLFFVIGDNKTGAGNKLVQIPSAKSLSEMGKSIGWRLCDQIPISVTREAPLHSRNAITENVVLHFQSRA